MDPLQLDEQPHRRYNPLTGAWIQVSPQRGKRPWRGRQETPPPHETRQYDPDCYLCPGNTRANGTRNPRYTSTFVFPNDFAALTLDTPVEEFNEQDLLIAQGEPGTCRVICFSPRHDLTLAEMEPPQIQEIIQVWTDEYRGLGRLDQIHYVQIFENKGALMGCSNHHPHGQIWAQRTIPDAPMQEVIQQRAYYKQHTSCLLCDYLELEQQQHLRVVEENAHFLAVVPFWALWPFEILLVSKRHLGNLLELTAPEQAAFAEILQHITIRYDNVFKTSFPYSAGVHPTPTDGQPYPAWHLHMHFYPPLFRSATVKKFMVGYEMLATPQRDLTPEAAAETLRSTSSIHYSRV